MATRTRTIETDDTTTEAAPEAASAPRRRAATPTRPASALPEFHLGSSLRSAFEKYETSVFYTYRGVLVCDTIAGGIPVDENVVESWLKTKLGVAKDDLLRQAVADTMVETQVTADQAVTSEAAKKHLNRFKRLRCPTCPPWGAYCADEGHQLTIEGRQLKAALKEGASVAVDTGVLDKARGYGQNSKKGLLSYFAETAFVVEDWLPLHVWAGTGDPTVHDANGDITMDGWVPALTATGINQRFVHTYRGSGIQYEEVVVGARVDFTIKTIHNYTPDEWAGIWLTGGQNGLGASRSQGFGRYVVPVWEPV